MTPLKWKSDNAEATSEVRNGGYAWVMSSGLWSIVNVQTDKVIHTARARSFADGKYAAGSYLQTLQSPPERKTPR